MLNAVHHKAAARLMSVHPGHPAPVSVTAHAAKTLTQIHAAARHLSDSSLSPPPTSTMKCLCTWATCTKPICLYRLAPHRGSWHKKAEAPRHPGTQAKTRSISITLMPCSQRDPGHRTHSKNISLKGKVLCICAVRQRMQNKAAMMFLVTSI